MSGEGGAGMEGPRGDFVKQFGDPDRTWVNKTPAKALQRALEPQNKEAYIQRSLESENIRKATEALEKIKQNPANLAVSEKQPSTADSDLAPKAQFNAPVPAERIPAQTATAETNPSVGTSSTGPAAETAKPEVNSAAAATTVHEVGEDVQEDAQAEAEEASGVEDKAGKVPLTEKEKPIRGKIAEKIAEHLDKELEEKSRNAENHNEKAIFDALRDRWKGDAGQKRLKEDFDRLKTDSPEQLMRELLKERTMYGKRVYTDAEIDALLADKSEGSFYKTMEPEVVLQVLQRKISEGGLTREDILSIKNTQWGKDTVEQALQKNEDAQKLVEQAIVKEEGKGIKKAWKNMGEFRKKFWEQAKKHPWVFIVALGLTGVPGLAVAYIALSAKEKG